MPGANPKTTAHQGDTAAARSRAAAASVPPVTASQLMAIIVAGMSGAWPAASKRASRG